MSSNLILLVLVIGVCGAVFLVGKASLRITRVKDSGSTNLHHITMVGFALYGLMVAGLVGIFAIAQHAPANEFAVLLHLDRDWRIAASGWGIIFVFVGKLLAAAGYPTLRKEKGPVA